MKVFVVWTEVNGIRSPHMIFTSHEECVDYILDAVGGFVITEEVISDGSAGKFFEYGTLGDLEKLLKNH